MLADSLSGRWCGQRHVESYVHSAKLAVCARHSRVLESGEMQRRRKKREACKSSS